MCDFTLDLNIKITFIKQQSGKINCLLETSILDRNYSSVSNHEVVTGWSALEETSEDHLD